jgi:hypothetical protein
MNAPPNTNDPLGEILENLSAYIATNTIQGYQERRKYDDKQVEVAKRQLQTLMLKERKDELSGVRLGYGHFVVETYITGEPQRIEARITDLDRQIKESEEL